MTQIADRAFDPQVLSERFASVRCVAGITQFELDALAGVPLGTAQSIESRKNANPSVKVLASVTLALRGRGLAGVSIDWLAGIEPTRRPSGRPPKAASR